MLVVERCSRFEGVITFLFINCFCDSLLLLVSAIPGVQLLTLLFYIGMDLYV